MTNKNFNQELLADILVYAIYNKFVDIEKYEDYGIYEDEMERFTKQDIIQIANQVLSKETLAKYSEFTLEKPNLFTKLDDATTEAKTALEAKHDILHQICLNIMEEFPTLQAVTIQSVEYAIIKITYANKQVENSTYIAINDEEQLKQNVQEFLDKIKIKKENSK